MSSDLNNPETENRGGNPPTTGDLNATRTLIEFLRANGVVHYAANGVTLTLLPEVPRAPEPDAPEVAKDERKRKDGLTRDQQLELYGFEME